MGPALSFLHGRLAISLVLFALILGVWGTYQFLRRRAVSGGFRSAYLLLAALAIIQSLVGAAEYTTGLRPGNALHVVYGIFAVLFLPGIYFLGHRRRDREAAFLATACWVVLIAFARGITTGRG